MTTQTPSQNDHIRLLLNDLLYVLTNSYYSGKDADKVVLCKQFVKDMKNDFEARMEAEAKAKVEEANKPNTPPKPVVTTEYQ